MVHVYLMQIGLFVAVELVKMKVVVAMNQAQHSETVIVVVKIYWMVMVVVQVNHLMTMVLVVVMYLDFFLLPALPRHWSAALENKTLVYHSYQALGAFGNFDWPSFLRSAG